jgi:hypothetical protein
MNQGNCASQLARDMQYQTEGKVQGRCPCPDVIGSRG